MRTKKGKYTYEGLPEHMRGAFKRYFENRIPPGGFAQAVICNDLSLAVTRADSTNRSRLLDYVYWLYEFAPVGSYGSYDNYNRWINEKEGN